MARTKQKTRKEPKLLSEAVVRRMMTIANLEPLSKNFLKEAYEDEEEEEDDEEEEQDEALMRQEGGMEDSDEEEDEGSASGLPPPPAPASGPPQGPPAGDAAAGGGTGAGDIEQLVTAIAQAITQSTGIPVGVQGQGGAGAGDGGMDGGDMGASPPAPPMGSGEEDSDQDQEDDQDQEEEDDEEQDEGLMDDGVDPSFKPLGRKAPMAETGSKRVPDYEGRNQRNNVGTSEVNAPGRKPDQARESKQRKGGQLQELMMGDPWPKDKPNEANQGRPKPGKRPGLGAGAGGSVPPSNGKGGVGGNKRAPGSMQNSVLDSPSDHLGKGPNTATTDGKGGGTGKQKYAALDGPSTTIDKGPNRTGLEEELTKRVLQRILKEFKNVRPRGQR